MSYSWLNKYIAIPYVPGGRTMEGLDCYGLVKQITLDWRGVVLPDWETDEIDLRKYHENIQSVVTSGTFTEIDKPQDGCFAICYRNKVSHHIGMVFKDGVIHTMHQGDRGVVFEALPRFIGNYQRVVFGVWEP